MAQSAAAEDSFYELLKRPYFAQNAASTAWKSCHKIRGFTTTSGDFRQPDPDRPAKRTVTVWAGTINVNTANRDPAGVHLRHGADAPRLQRSWAEAQKFLMMVTMLRGRCGIRCFHARHVHLFAAE